MLDELVATDALVRVVDAWVESLDMKGLGFARAQAQTLGAPPYAPADLLRLYLWGYLNAVRSSRALERECRRNVECMWLLGRLAPDHKTIANFRRDSTVALVAVCAAFVVFARQNRLVAGSTVAIDGTKVRAVASRKAIRGHDDLAQEAADRALDITAYLQQLDSQDSQELASSVAADDVRAALARLRRQGSQTTDAVQRLAKGGTLVVTEPQAQAMRSLHGAPGYNLQTAVETTSHLIVAHDVNADSNDQRQLRPMAQAASDSLAQKCIVIADAGYSNGEHLAALDAQGITSYVAPNPGINNQGNGALYDKTVFAYDAASDSFLCPAGKRLLRKQVMKRDKVVIYAARPEDCGACADKPACTQARQRCVSRHFFEDALSNNTRRLANHPEMMAMRRQTVEHPFGTIKFQILGNARLLMRGILGAKAELSLAVLAYNLKRACNMKSRAWMLQTLGA